MRCEDAHGAPRAGFRDLGVSLRTVYRDVADLQLSGVPIEGEAGVGYLLRRLRHSAADVHAA